MKKIILSTFLTSTVAQAQVQYPNSATSSGSLKAERVSSYTVNGAGNDRLEIVNGTQIDGRFIPTLWSYRGNDNAYSMVLTASTDATQDNGTNPLMLFTANTCDQINLGAPATGDFPWGEAGTTSAVLTRPLFEWRNGASKIMTMAANGNIGIGTSIPIAGLDIQNKTVRIGNTTTPLGYKLYVEQGILTEKVKVAIANSSAWADYVFATDYKLAPLSEVENYVKANKHLPNIPSADQLAKEGLNLGEMQAKQMEKIEEITLYMIEMKKEIEALKKENNDLKKNISTISNSRNYEK